MKIYKKTIFRMFFVIEIFIFVGVYLFGGNGLQYLACLKKENYKLYDQVVALKHEIVKLEKDIVDWNSNDFYKEKIAREKLQMARKGDQIYFLSSKGE